MPDVDGSVITAHVATTSEATPCRRKPRRRKPFGVGLAAIDLGMWPRMAAVIVLSAVAYGVSYGQIVADAIAGSRAAYLVVVPALAALIAFGYRSAPRGVGDSESDSIAATLLGIVGLTAIHLISQRTPALAGLWRLHLLEVVVWFGCAVVVLFGVRRAVQMWELWLFAVLSATPLPFLMATAALGGSDLASALLAAALGAVAVFLAGRFAPIVPRVGTALGSFAVAATVVSLTPLGEVNLLLVIVATSGLIPVLAIAALSGATAARRPIDESNTPHTYPRISPISLGVLVAMSLVLLAINPAGAASPAVSTVSPDWMKRAGLSAPTSFPFITRFLGPGSTLDRYEVPGVAGMPAAAVDVMTANGAALQDYVDAVWYPTTRPLDYSPAEPTGAMPLGARVIHTNADTATDGAGGDWYAVTWLWHSGDVSQQVTVTVSQTVGGDQPPPAPAGLSLVQTALRPAMWLARQQPHQTGQVDPRVSQRAAEVVGLLVRHGAAGEAPPGA